MSEKATEATAVESLEALLDVVYVHVSALRVAVADAVVAGETTVASEELRGVKDVVTALVAAIPWAGGGGFVAALDTVDAEHRFWEWWSRGRGEGGVEQLHPPRTSAGGADYAYESMQWFRDGQANRPCVFGPFVDFAGVNQLVILCAEPVIVGGHFFGVVGVDLVVDRFEIQVVRILRGLPGPAALVGATNRVIASNVATLAPGERFDSAGWVVSEVDQHRSQWRLYRREPV